MLRSLFVLALVVASPALADKEIFHGWSKDGTWLVYEAKSVNDAAEFYFCATDQAVPPTWPAALNDVEQVDERTLTCIRFTDPNRLPLDWKKLLVLPDPSLQSGTVRVLPELVGEGETPGFQLEGGGKKQVCYAAQVRDDSKLGATWFHPNGKWVAALIDGQFRHCPLTLKGAGTAKGKKK